MIEEKKSIFNERGWFSVTVDTHRVHSVGVHYQFNLDLDFEAESAGKWQKGVEIGQKLCRHAENCFKKI